MVPEQDRRGDNAFWEHAARRDPLWAILSDPSKKGRRWRLDDFFETGRREISLLLYQLSRLGIAPPRGRALDFGCGVGRLTQALAAKFDEAIGVDISPTMLRLANSLNRFPSHARYVLNCEVDLVHEGVTWFGDRGSQTSRQPIDVARDGLIGPAVDVDNAGTGSGETYPDIYADLTADGFEIGDFPMYGIPRDEVLALISNCASQAILVEPDERGGAEWAGYRYFMRKNA